MKLRKRFLLMFGVIVLLILGYSGIVLTNNYLAQRIETELAAYQLPTKTVLVDSLSVAGKLTGNGNGMQHMGTILVESELSREELLAYYSSQFEYIEVREQTSPELDFIHSRGHRFEGFQEIDGRTYYSVTCWDDNRRELVGDFVGGLLDLDIRGH